MPSDDEKHMENDAYSSLDNYLVAQGGYDPDNFYFRSTDDKGHSTTVRLCIPLYMGGDLRRIVDSGYFPYRTPEDIGRDAIYHRLYFLNGRLDDPTVEKTLHMEARQAFYEHAVSRAMAEEHLVDQATSAITTLARLKATSTAEVIHQLTQDALDLENPKARTRALKVIEKYGKG